MSEEQNSTPAGAPTDGVSKKPRLLAGAPTDGISRPRALAAGGASLGSLKVSMTPQQLAAIEKAKQAQAEAEAAEQARLADEARYQEELRIYQEYQAAEQARLAEEARIAAEQQALAEDEASRLTQEAALAQQLADQSQSAESQTLAEEATRQLAAAQELMSRAKAMQQQVAAAQAPAPTPSIPMPSVPMPSVTAPSGIPAPSSFGTPEEGSTDAMPGAPTAGVSAALRKPLSPSMTLVKDNSTPLWKNKVVIAISSVIVLGMGAWAYMEYDKKKTVELENTRYVQLITEGSNPDVAILTGIRPEDIDLILKRFKAETQSTNWQAGARTLKKICDANADLAIRILDDIAKNPKAYSFDKKRRMLFFLVTVKNPPSDLRQRMLDLYAKVDEDIKPDLIWFMYPLLGDEDIPMLIDIINDPKNDGKLAAKAEATASKVIAKSPNKGALTQEIQNQYNNADDVKKNVYIRLMGKTGDQSGLDFLKKIVLDDKSSAPSKRNSLKALGAWPNDDAIGLILDVAKSPFGQNKETAVYVTDELYNSLSKPGRKRDDAKFKPLMDHINSITKTESEKSRLIGALASNTKSDQWAIDIIKSFETDINNKVSFNAEKALEAIMKREDPSKKPAAKKKAAKSNEEEELEMELGEES